MSETSTSDSEVRAGRTLAHHQSRQPNPMANVQRLHGKDVTETLRDDEVALFPYQINQIGFTMILVLGGVFLACAGAVWWWTGLASPIWTAAFVGALAAGGAIGVLAAYWYSFAQTRFLAVSESKLYVGRHKRMWSIDWSLLDAETLGLEQMEATRMRGSLDVHVGGQDIEIHLYNAYAHLEDIQTFMFTVLKKLKGEDVLPAEEMDS